VIISHLKRFALLGILSLGLTACAVHASPPIPGATPVVQAAQRYVGMTEHKDRSRLKTFLGIDPRRTPWCAAFVNSVLERTGFTGTDSLMARSFLNYGVRTHSPAVGDIAVFRRGRSPRSGHVGFYVGEDDTYVHVLGGNQRGGVSIAQYPKNLLLGYRKITTAQAARRPAPEPKAQTQMAELDLPNPASRYTLSPAPASAPYCLPVNIGEYTWTHACAG